MFSDVHEAELRAFASQVYNISEGDLSLDEIMLSTDLKFRVTSFLRQLGRGHGFVAFELVEGAVMVKGGFTVENGLRMADGIVNRKRIMEVYAAEIDVSFLSPWASRGVYVGICLTKGSMSVCELTSYPIQYWPVGRGNNTMA